MPTITKPITVTKVRNALGVRSTDVGTLCTHANVRHWARFKPMDMPGIAQDKRDTSDYLRLTNYWKGKCGENPDVYDYRGEGNGMMLKISTCGVNFYAFTDLLYCLDVWLQTTYDDNVIANNYSWDKPKGGEKSPYRLGDFIGYDNTIGCQFWSDILDDPNVQKERLPKYNPYAMMPIRCKVETYGGNGISLIQFLRTIGATSIRLCAVGYDEMNLETAEFLGEAAFDGVVDSNVNDTDGSNDPDGANNTFAELNVSPQSEICEDNKVIGVAYFVKFISSVYNNTPTTFYMPITQRVDGGENTKVRMADSGKTHYGLKRFVCTMGEPASFNFMQLNANARGYGNMGTYGWTGWLDNNKISDKNLVSNNLWLYFQAKATNTEAFRFNKDCVKFEFTYVKDGVYQTYEIDGQEVDTNRIRITNSSDWQSSIQEVMVQGTAETDIYIALPDTFTGGNESLSGMKIVRMDVWWRTSTNFDYKQLSGFNLNITVS